MLACGAAFTNAAASDGEDAAASAARHAAVLLHYLQVPATGGF